MPIFSAANSTQFSEDERYIPETEIHPASAPEYAFYFYPEEGFRTKYNFDNCRDFGYFNRGLKYREIDFNHQDLYYRRLFSLKNVEERPKFYLCPWLIVPFEGATATLNSLKLVVKPYSIYDGANSRKIKSRIVGNNPNPADGRTLELCSSGNGVDASWANPKPGSASTVIDELACVAPQTVNITIPGVAPTYDYSSYIEIRAHPNASTASYVILGRVYLVFLPIVNKDVIFCDVKATPNSQSQIDVRILGGAGSTQQAELQAKLNDLNEVYEMSAIRYAAPDVSISLTGIVNPLVTGGTVTVDTGATLSMHDSSEGPRIARAFKRKIAAINGTAWNESAYLFVFLIPITPPEAGFAGDPQSVGTTSGATAQWFRAPCVYDYRRKTLAHESAHGLGLPHSFYDGSVKYLDISLKAEASARSMSLLSTQDLYLFCDDVNSTGLKATLTTRFGVADPLTVYERASKIEAITETRRYYIYQTENLLDYLNSSKMPENQEQLRKDQIEQIRFYA
jgi:hypothetical protein